MSLPDSSTMAAEDDEKAESAAESAEALVRAVREQLTPRHILTRKAFENAIAVVMAVGGSTNAVLHLLAIAHAARVPLELDDFEAIRARVPVLCDLKPSGRYVATDLHRAGGMPQVMKMLLEHGLLHGDALTITGNTIAETLRGRAGGAAGRSGRDPAVEQAAVPPGTSRHSAGQPGARGSGREDHRREDAAHHRPGAGLRVGGVVSRRDPRGTDQAGGRGGDPLRGAEGRPGDAGDARAHVGDHRRRARRLGGADHRRALLRRHLRAGRRPRRAGSRGRRADRAGARGRFDHHRRGPAPARDRGSRPRAGAAAVGMAGPRPRATRRGCCSSTRDRSRAQASEL